MIKSDLIRALADDNPHLRVADAEAVVNAIFNGIAMALSRGDRVELRGFGAFTVRQRRARTGRNPKSGGLVPVEAKSVPSFKAGQVLRERVDRGGGAALLKTKRARTRVSQPPVRVAVIDNDGAVLESIRFLLEVQGHVVSTFASAAALLDVLPTQVFDCLLVDHHMPYLTGLELAQHMRAGGDMRPIMLMSGSMTPDIMAKAALIEIQEVVEKPMHDALITRFVESARRPSLVARTAR